MPSRYYRGSNNQYAKFWADFVDVPGGKHLKSFVKFFRDIKQDVMTGRCTLREAGYALEPSHYDEALLIEPHAADITMVGILASELAGGVFESGSEAEDIWQQIVLILDKYS